jgi:enterochelin esterase family protein
VRPYRGTNPGRLERFTHKSEVLGNERWVDVYLPPGYDESKNSYPLLVVNDGKAWLERAVLPNSLDNLIGSKVAPLIVAFVEMPRRASRDEFGGSKSADHVRMLADELLPYLDGRYRTLPRAESRAILGVSRGGLMAAYAALERPTVFGKCGGFSVYLVDPLGPEVLQRLETQDKGGKASFLVTWNRYDLRRAEWGLDVARDSERLTRALEAAGYAVAGGEVADGSGWGGWRVRGGEALERFFPAR